MLHPKYKRRLKQIIPFAIIWLVFGLIYSFVEGGIMGRLTCYTPTASPYDFSGNLIFRSVSCILVGTVQGLIEVYWLRRRFEKKALWVKMVLKIVFYLIFMVVLLGALSSLNNLFSFNQGELALKRFVDNFGFWSIIIYIGATISFAIFFSEMSQYAGDGVLFNFLFGKYHKPKHEIRIFMFLDMKSSTTIAEKIGHEKYFDLLKAYYADMTDAILETSGEIYQYVGDEIVVSWPQIAGIQYNNCIQCFAKISDTIEKKREEYLKAFGLVPEFKAGYHIGSVTTGEIGIIKKDIIHTGDVLNTTARIQAECNTYNAKTLISGDLLEELLKEEPISYTKIGEFVFRGKTEPIELFSISI